MKKEKSVYMIQSVCGALDVLEQFLDDADELGMTELSRILNVPKNKVFRLLITLESRNFIERNKTTANYRLGLKNLQLGQTFVKQSGLLRQARPILESLTEKCQETSYVAILKDYKTIYLDSIESDHPVRIVTNVGKKLPFYCTAAGKVLAAYLNDKNLWKHIQNGELKKYTPNTISDPDKLISHLRGIAESGYALDDEELYAGVKSVGAPIRDYTKQVIGAVSISGPSMRLTPERMNQEFVPRIKEAAEELSARLGYKTADPPAKSAGRGRIRAESHVSAHALEI